MEKPDQVTLYKNKLQTDIKKTQASILEYQKLNQGVSLEIKKLSEQIKALQKEINSKKLKL